MMTSMFFKFTSTRMMRLVKTSSGFSELPLLASVLRIILLILNSYIKICACQATGVLN